MFRISLIWIYTTSAWLLEITILEISLSIWFWCIPVAKFTKKQKHLKLNLTSLLILILKTCWLCLLWINAVSGTLCTVNAFEVFAHATVCRRGVVSKCGNVASKYLLLWIIYLTVQIIVWRTVFPINTTFLYFLSCEVDFWEKHGSVENFFHSIVSQLFLMYGERCT